MAQHGPGTASTEDRVGWVVRAEAEALARRHGLDVERVWRILARTAVNGKGRTLRMDSRFVRPMGLRFEPSLAAEIGRFGPEAALSLFQRAGPETLLRRSRLVRYLAARTTPFHTLDELADLLEACGRHLDRNRAWLLRTGYPETGFAASPWLDWLLTPRLPKEIQFGS